VIDGEFEKKSAQERNVPCNHGAGSCPSQPTHIACKIGKNFGACKLTSHPSYSSHIVLNTNLGD